MTLADNTAKIRALIESIGTLPDVGNGGGGLPEGVSKLISGSFTPTYDMTDSIIIPHGFGEKPTFSIVAIEDDVSETMIPNAVYWQFEFLKKAKYTQDVQTGQEEWRNYIQSFGYFCYVYNEKPHISTTWFESNINSTIGEDEYQLNATTVWISPIYNSGNNTMIPFKAGHTYRWVCGVIDGIN